MSGLKVDDRVGSSDTRLARPFSLGLYASSKMRLDSRVFVFGPTLAIVSLVLPHIPPAVSAPLIGLISIY